ncbi:MAG: TraG/TraD/VirD4 family protein [Acidobacteriota bacterium]|nr:TraG/TraD/VirD4 family protein [Acidobacteriota bacterium]
MSPRIRVAENVVLEPWDFMSHIHGVGLSRTGKSKLIELIVRDFITKRVPFCLVDPHGTLYNAILDWLVVMKFDRPLTLFDPARGTGFNPFRTPYTTEAQIMTKTDRLVSATLMAWGITDAAAIPKLTKLLTAIYYVILEQHLPISVFDVFLDFSRERERTAVRNSTQSDWVRHQLGKLCAKTRSGYEAYLDSVDNKLRVFAHAQVRQVFTAPPIDLRALVDSRGMLLANLQADEEDRIGEEANRVIGTLLVNEFWEITRKRQTAKEFYLVIDECQRFMTPDVGAMLAEGAKYGLHLLLFHQDRSQVTSRAGALRNAQTKIAFSTEESPLPRRHFVLRRADHSSFRGIVLPVTEFKVSREKREALITRLTKDFLASEPIDAIPVFEAPISTHEPATRHYVTVDAETETPVALLPPSAPRREKPAQQVTARARRVIPEPPTVEHTALSLAPTALGRGGAQHKYLQQLVKRWGEDKGYLATIEKPILGGVGSVDVALERDGVRIACEISITTSVEHELGNVEKCLAADFTHVAFIASEKKVLTKAKKVIAGALSETSAERVQFFAPEDFLLFLEELDAQAASKEETVRGYKVKVKYRPVNEEEKKVRKKAINQTILQALKRLKDSDGK